MLRDIKFLRRNSGEETENLPVNTKDSSGAQVVIDSSVRPPLNAIQEPALNAKGGVDQEGSVRVYKSDRTPTKPRGANPMHQLRTPEKPVVSKRFGWGQKGESSLNSSSSSSSVAVEMKDEGKADLNGGSYSQLRSAMANFITPRTARNVGRANSEGNSTQTTPTKSVSKPPNPGFCLTSGSRAPPSSGGSRMSNYAALSKGISSSYNSNTVVNTVEVPHFELKEDPSFWLEHNVQVLIRVRPLSNAEKGIAGYTRCLKQESAQTITWIGQPETRFTFDHVACETIDQETLFRMVGLPMVENCLSGYNSCMFAYGQTGSGKTHTMLGDIEDLEIRPSTHRGMTPRIFEFLFARIRAEEESRKDEKLRYHCRCSFLEIYNEQITDLLDPSSTNLMLREDMKKGVYVENLSAIEVQTVGDILKLLRQGSLNRRVAATNMNRESSRSHSVFTCEIESRWEKDSTSNFRFARLNLVDLAGSERQKTSGAEGERLKEAANINKSLSTLGHVIMVLVDVANGRQKHIPYRDSRLTFLLQDSLGGNSKTMIIANVSPSIWCAAETLNTLKFAQRAKLIQNNAIVNEDSSGDVVALQNQIRFLKEELCILKRQNVSRSLSFGPADEGIEDESSFFKDAIETDSQAHLLSKEGKGSLRVSTKQMKSFEGMLAGALRREQMAEISIKQLEAENEQLNRLVQQREEDTRCTKMMLKFREDKIQRMESLVRGLMPTDAYLQEENCTLSSEIQLLRAKIEKNPEVTRFALENIRLLEQLRRFQDFYEEGEREMLLAEVSQLREQFMLSLDGNLKQHHQEPSNVSKENVSLQQELKKTQNELEECRSKLNSCLEYNTKLSREVDTLRFSMNLGRPLVNDHEESSAEVVVKESISEAPPVSNQPKVALQKEKKEIEIEKTKDYVDEILHLQLESDILKTILKEERSYSHEREGKVQLLSRDLDLSKEKVLLVTKQYEAMKEELKEAQSVIEALESQQLLSIDEIEDLRNKNCYFEDLSNKQELELSSLKLQNRRQEFRSLSSSKILKREDFPLEDKLNKMHDSLEKAKRLNKRYQSDKAYQASHEEEVEEVRRQVEAETVEVIVCLQEELSLLQEEVQASNLKEMETEQSLALLQTEMQEMEDKFSALTDENTELSKLLEDRDNELRKSSHEWELLTNEIEAVLQGGFESLKDASEQLHHISNSFPQKRSWISAQFDRISKCIFEKEVLIEELNHYLEDASSKGKDMECMLNSLRGAALAMTEAHQQECCEKDKEMFRLTSQLSAEASTVSELKNKIRHGEAQLRKTSTCATVALVAVNRLSELNSKYLDELNLKDTQLMALADANVGKDSVVQSQTWMIDEAEKQIQSLREDIKALEASCSVLGRKLSEEQNSANSLRQELEAYEEDTILQTDEKLTELENGVSEVRSCITAYVDGSGYSSRHGVQGEFACLSSEENDEMRTGSTRTENPNDMNSHFDQDREGGFPHYASDIGGNVNRGSSGKKNLLCQRLKDIKNREATIMLLKAEIESALESLKGVQTEITKLRSEKKNICVSEQESRRGIESIVAQVLVLSNAMDYFEDEVKIKIGDLEGKLLGFERALEDSCNSWFEQKELLEEALGDASLVSTQKDAEASYVLSKFDEIQYTMKDADIMINELMIANETLKLEVSELKKKEASLVCDRDCLASKVQSLQSVIDQKDGQLEELKVQLGSDFETINKSLQELEVIVSQVQTVSMEECFCIASDCLSTKSQFHESVKLLSACHEDVCSDIILKNTAVSVLHICHLGILLETVTGLNAENGLLSHGLGESNEAISELRKQNHKAMEELESCRVLEGKLLEDIKNSFDRISRHEVETGELRIKLKGFEQKLLDLQSEEELMMQRSNRIGAELNVLLMDLDHSNKEKEGVRETREENFLVEMCARDFEVLILSSQLKQVNSVKTDLERAHLSYFKVLNACEEAVVLHAIDASLTESILLEREAELCSLSNNFNNLGKELQDLLADLETRNSTIAQMEDLNKTLRLDVESLKEVASLADDLKSDLEEATKAKQMLSLQVEKLNAECGNLTEEKKMVEAALEVSSKQLSSLEDQNKKLEKDNCLLESNKLEKEDSELRKLNCLEHEEKMLQDEIQKVKAEYCSLFQDLEDKKDELESSLREKAVLDAENQTLGDKVSLLENQSAALQMDLEVAKEEADELHTELLRKDEILNGVLFDMSVLQESASISMDQKDEIGSLLDSLGALRNELILKSANLDETVKLVQDLDAQLKEKIDKIISLENDIAKEQETVLSLTSLNHELVAKMGECTKARELLEEELIDRRKVSENLEIEIVKMEVALGEINRKVESLESNLIDVNTERDDLQEKARALMQELQMAQTIGEEKGVLANEAQELAEIRKVNIEEKEEEVKLLERSVEELERTVDVLENQFEVLKGEAERQRLEREELEVELHGFKQQMQSVENFDADMRRKLDDNERNLEESLQHIQVLEKEIAARDAEMARCKVHIDELNLHAEAQASEYKQKFKVLEAMLEQVKQEVPASANTMTLSANKLEKNGSKSRGSGSPFKCIGLGIAQQIKSEKEEELSAGRHRIEELEALAASRQKEIFMLNARLATAESMTHDVIRDLLGLKLDMNSCATLMNNKQVQVLMDKAQSHNVQEEEVVKLKEQLNEFVKERKGWIEEIDRKQAEVVTAQVTLEKLRQRDQLLTTENQLLKVESTNYKKRAMELEAEIKKLSGQQNLQQRIHHHAKIKEENNMLKCHNDELSAKLRRTDALLLRVKQELVQYRAAGGRNPHINFDEEERLSIKLKETETERFQLAHELISLCTSILKAAGITRPPTSEINRSVAEEALDELKSRMNALERELEAAKMKNRMNKERIRLSELMPGNSSPLSSRTDHQQTPYLSSFDR